MQQLSLPEKGVSRDELFSKLRSMHAGDTDWRQGRMFSLIYNAGADVERIARDAYAEFMVENALSPFSFPSLLKMENEVMSMVTALFHGAEAVGSMTSGGSESILMAVKTGRDWARENKPDVHTPEVLMPVTAHPAFNKAAHFLGLKTVSVPVGQDYRADITAVQDAVSDNTVMLVGSAFSYPHGMIDPIAEMSDLALENNIWFHTDACLGGFMLPFLEQTGYAVRPFDFRLAGVKSISADIHKYGYTPKGASTILYRSKDLRKYQIFAYSDWPGGVYGTPCVSGARPGGAIASAWAVMHYLGREGFCRLAGRAMETTVKLRAGIARIPGLYVLGDPDATVLAFGSTTLNIYDLQQVLKKMNWHIESQHLPPCLHLTVSPVHAETADAFLADLAMACTEAATINDATRAEDAVLYGVMGTLPDRSMAKAMAVEYLNDLYSLK